MVNTLNKAWDKFIKLLENNNFYREKSGAVVAGVCQGLANKTGIRVNLIRVVWLFMSVGTYGTALIVYVICSLIMPEKPKNPDYKNMSYVDSYAREKK